METSTGELKIRSGLLQGEIAQAIRRAVMSGRFRPGERLVEEELANKLGVSRAPVREALKELVAEGLLVNIPRRGTTVIELTESDIREIYSLRMVLEALAVEILASTITPAQMAELEAFIEQMREALQRHDVPAVVDLDMRFHEMLCLFSGHSRLHRAWSRMGGQLRSFFAAADRLYEDRQITERHQELLAAIASGDRDRAVATLKEHISNAAERVLASTGLDSGARQTGEGH